MARSDWSRAAGGPEGWDNSATAADNTTMLTEDRRDQRSPERKGILCVSAVKIKSSQTCQLRIAKYIL